MAKHNIGAKRPKWDRSERYTSKEYLPYVTAIGQLALAWNDLHEALGSLFVSIVSVDDPKIQAAWQSLQADRAKRGMLRAAIREMSAEQVRLNPRAEDEMKWLLNQIDRLENERNNAIHSPLMSFSHPVWRSGLTRERPDGIGPDDIRGNRLATNLRNKNLLIEYRAVRDEAIIFRDYVEAIEQYWNWSDKRLTPWPEKPQLPNRGQKSRRRARRADRPKQLLLLHESSQE